MQKREFIKKIAEDSELDYKTTKKVIENFEELMLDIIAMNDSIDLRFAIIGGYEKEPRKITGYYSVLRKVEKRHGWTVCKSGSPFCNFTKEANYYTPIDPEEFFARVDQKYKTKARQFRKDYNLPEIPEYEGLSEEEIEELCVKADILNMDKYQKRRYYKNKKNKLKGQVDTKIIQEDLKKQLDSGIPKDQLKIRSKEEIIKDLEKEWKQVQNREYCKEWDPGEESYASFYNKYIQGDNKKYNEIKNDEGFFADLFGEDFYTSEILDKLSEMKEKEKERQEQKRIEKARRIKQRKERKG